VETPASPDASAAPGAIPGATSGSAFNPGLAAIFKPAVPEVVKADANPITPEKIALGRMLYYENRISLSQSISCNTCHALDKYGIDPRTQNATSEGHNGQFGGRNSPTVYNAAGHIAQFWDGRAADVEAQAQGPVLNPVEMAMPDPEYVIKVLKSIPGYVDAFKAAFPGEADPVTYDNFGKAVGAFERKLTTPGKWDQFLGGDTAALSDAEKSGLATFVSAGCITCHMGTYLGGQMYQKTGLIQPWPNQKDQGRFDVTKNDADKMMFKVPSLRNIARTAPYFHDGSVADLGEAVRLMATHQLGKDLSDADVDSIVTFLNALTGQIPVDYIAKPDLPAAGPDTPGPQTKVTRAQAQKDTDS
jgi:cytochrome c peroxidase